jgi:hypothetical protein
MNGINIETADLRSMKAKELMALFETLKAPDISEMKGEYSASMLPQVLPIFPIINALALYNPLLFGRWLCKAFRPVDAKNGRGYNTFRHFGKTVQRFPMNTFIAPSRYDGKPAFQLVYRAYRSSCGFIHMVDEVRMVRENVYLGIGTYGFSDWQRNIPMPFLLIGPDAEYRGDIGKERGKYDLGKEVPSLRK